jgi:DNA invertase Pin-like site-specific DNA recombinase
MLLELNEDGRRIGESHPRAKYSEREVEEVRRLFEDGVSRTAIARVLHMPYPTVRAILSGRRRTQTPDRIVEAKP